jgi:ATPase subunit of ABC transporter with duplicated ATPase domains
MSRIKQLEKIVPIEVDEVDNKQMHLKFPPCLRSGDYPIICDEVRKDYGAHTVFDHVTFTIKRGEKVAFVGKNGEGKSTLVKCIMGEIPFTGTLKIGHNVQIGYFAQNQAQLLDENLTNVHPGRHAERVQHDVHRAAVFHVRHVLDRQDARYDTLVTVTTGHLVTRLFGKHPGT